MTERGTHRIAGSSGRAAPGSALALAAALGPFGAASAAGSATAVAAPTIVSPVCRSFARTGTVEDAATNALPDGSVWYADKSGSRLVRIARDGTQTPFVPTDGAVGRVSGIAIGPDGNVWYTKDTGNRVGRIPPAGGTGVEFAVPESNSFPTGIVADRRGQLWFGAPVRHYVGLLGVDGSIAVNRGPSAQGRDFTPKAMALGPDGNLWTTDHGFNAILRFDVGARAFTRFDIATPGAQPGAIAPAADGALWFTMFAPRKVGRITTQGVITEYALGDLGGGAPRGVVGTADGSVWVTTSGRVAVRFRPDGTQQTFACGQGLGTAVIGPDGAPWFFDNARVWVVEEAATPRAAAPVAAAAAKSPWPVKGAPSSGAGAAAIPTLTLREAIERLPRTKGRVVLQVTSTDPNCGFCLQANPVLDAIAVRRAKDATFWRVDYSPWKASWQDPDVMSAGIRGLPTIVVFDDGQEVRRVQGSYPEREIEAQLFPPK